MHRLSVAAVLLLVPACASAQSAPSRDPQALAVLQQAITAMGGSAPNDSTATATINTSSGAATDTGTVVVMTRGNDQTSEQMQTGSATVTLVYSQGTAAQVQGETVTPIPMESAVTSQSADFPLPLLVGMLNDPDSAYAYIGLETLNGANAHHIQLWTTFASVPSLTAIATFSVRDIWLDVASGLPLRISYEDHLGQGASSSVAFDVMFSNYAAVNGVQYPFLITKSVNGTPWATITITNVVFNTGLTDTNFPVN
jgi:hypothetical protein